MLNNVKKIIQITQTIKINQVKQIINQLINRLLLILL